MLSQPNHCSQFQKGCSSSLIEVLLASTSMNISLLLRPAVQASALFYLLAPKGNGILLIRLSVSYAVGSHGATTKRKWRKLMAVSTRLLPQGAFQNYLQIFRLHPPPSPNFQSSITKSISNYGCIRNTLPVSMNLWFYEYINPSIYKCINLSIYQSISLSIYQSINLSIYQSINLSFYQFIYLYIFQSINLSIYQSIILSIYQSINLSIYQSISLLIYQPTNL